MNIQLREWQKEALKKSHNWLLELNNRNFLINAAPGSGKTIASCAIAQSLIELNKIDRVIVIAPRSEVVNQWAKDFELITKRYMAKVTASDGNISQLRLDICATWTAITGLLPELKAVCRTSNVLIICDEHHHAAIKAVWGQSADSAFIDAKYALILTGTPIRSDGEESIWMAYDENGKIDHPDDGSYTLTYGQAVDLNYCRPVTFHRHEGNFNVVLDNKELTISSQEPVTLTGNLKDSKELQKILDFSNLVNIPQYENNTENPSIDGYQASMMEYAIEKLDELRLEMPTAGGLIIAPSIEFAEYFAKLVKIIDGEPGVIVHSLTTNPDLKIDRYRKTNARWLISVGMVSEGVDIKRLRLLVYLPRPRTELAFRQAVGRVVRTFGPNDNSRAYVIMPPLEIFDMYARTIENEMPPSAREKGQKTKKHCPICNESCQINELICPCCEHQFIVKPPRLKTCESCDHLNPLKANECENCGESFNPSFSMKLEEAMRLGVITRGMDISEEEATEGERIAPLVKSRILASGDSILINTLNNFPPESFARIKDIVNNT